MHCPNCGEHTGRQREQKGIKEMNMPGKTWKKNKSWEEGENHKICVVHVYEDKYHQNYANILNFFF